MYRYSMTRLLWLSLFALFALLVLGHEPLAYDVRGGAQVDEGAALLSNVRGTQSVPSHENGFACQGRQCILPPISPRPKSNAVVPAAVRHHPLAAPATPDVADDETYGCQNIAPGQDHSNKARPWTPKNLPTVKEIMAEFNKRYNNPKYVQNNLVFWVGVKRRRPTPIGQPPVEYCINANIKQMNAWKESFPRPKYSLLDVRGTIAKEALVKDAPNLEFWKVFSQAYAEWAQGTVHVYASREAYARTDSIWHLIERPTLLDRGITIKYWTMDNEKHDEQPSLDPPTGGTQSGLHHAPRH